MQPDGGVINEATAARIAALERELHQKLCDLDEASSQAEAVSSENVALRDELGRMQDRMHVLEQDCSATRVPPLPKRACAQARLLLLSHSSLGDACPCLDFHQMQ